MKKISVEIVADSISERGDRITTLLLTFPRFILSELNTHRMLSKNSASSRAIPFEKMVKMVEEDPFIPIAWQKDHKGMQGTEYFTDESEIDCLENDWDWAMRHVISQARLLHKRGATKQLCNRILEPFMWHTVLVTATEWENFFELRCPQYQTPVSQTIEPQRSWKDLLNNHSNPINEKLIEDNKNNWSFKFQYSKSQAEIHMQALAEAIWDARNESIPKLLKKGEYHIPFGDKINPEDIANTIGFKTSDYDWYNKELWSKIQIATARCARLSYMTFDGEINYLKDIKLHDQLLESGHMSPFEHVNRCMSREEFESFFKGEIKTTYDELGNYSVESDFKNLGWCNNFKGWIPYRYLIENENK